jgi:hypothetical protein
MVEKRTYDEWARIVLEIWKDRMMKYMVRDTGELFQSLRQHVIAQAEGSVERIDFFFNLYGVYVDMGVGRGFAPGNTGDIGKETRRKAKPWYASAFYGQVKKLTEILAEKYGRQAAQQICGFISGAVDYRIAANYQASRDRSRRNYQRRRQYSGHWTKQGHWKIGFHLENHRKTIS